MKAALAGLGFSSLGIISLGSLFKIQHYPGASLMLLLGSFMFVFGFLPVYLVFRIKNKKNSIEIIEAIILTISLAFIALGLLFKVQHYPGGAILYIIGTCLFIGLFLPFYLVRFVQEKQNANIQKILTGMIVFTLSYLFMSYNISKETMSSYILNEENTSNNNKVYQLINERIYNRIEKSGNELGIEKAKKIKILSYDIYNLIEAYKDQIIMESDGLNEEMLVKYNINDLSLKSSHNKDGVDVVSSILIGDPGSPSEGKWSAVYLKSQLINYRKNLISITNSEKTKEELNTLLNFEDVEQFGRQESWEVSFFYHMTLVSVVNTLSSIQYSTSTAEALVLSEINN